MPDSELRTGIIKYYIQANSQTISVDNRQVLDKILTSQFFEKFFMFFILYFYLLFIILFIFW